MKRDKKKPAWQNEIFEEEIICVPGHFTLFYPARLTTRQENGRWVRSGW
jgi:hypothetical protein